MSTTTESSKTISIKSNGTMGTYSGDIAATGGLWHSQPSLTDSTFSHRTWNEKDELHSNANKGIYTCDKYLRGSVLGQGAWSVVTKVKRIADGKLFAGKASCDEQLNQEIKILLKFSHKLSLFERTKLTYSFSIAQNNILKVVELHQQGEAAGAKILITELCEEGDLGEHIYHVPGGMGKRDILLVMSQIGDALAFIHEQNYYHSDVKPRNILIRKLNPIEVVLADCADCQVCGTEIYGDKDIRTQTGTYKFWSPEMAKHIRHDGKEDDIWALGITLLSMMAQLPEMRVTHKKKIYDDVYKHTGRCGKQARDLLALNPEDGLVKLAGRMLVLASKGRIIAAECSQEAKKLLEQLDKDGEESKGKGTEGLGIQSPEGFKPISFW
ncbi:serine/threonine protein kinase [Trichoderma harzianum]|uniref:Serine/threonine protein kinase n=1 Tax=Trichoderma harzianum TaxID=5544 RepID=A0A0F9ZY56_TRIHA|nr:serine/threonine protein kinase [Trichoderma harzianum]